MKGTKKEMPNPKLVRRNKIYKDVEPLMKLKKVKPWVESKKGDNQKTSKYHMAAFLRWRRRQGYGADPDKWIEECIDGTNRTLIQHLAILKEWVEGSELDGSSPATRSKYYTDLRSFYKFHSVPLPFSKLNAKNDETKVRREPTATEFLKNTQKVLEGEIRTRDKAIILVMLQGGMDASTLAKSFNIVGYSQLAKHFGVEDWAYWDENNTPVQLDLVRPKTDYRFYTFIDKDAIVALKDWLNARSSLFGAVKIKRPASPQLIAPSDPIFLTDYGAPLRAHYITNLFEFYGVRAGVNIVPDEKVQQFKGASRRYPFHSHEVRDTLITIARRAKVDIAVANFFAGHDIDEYHYDKSPWDDPDHFREQYKRLAPYLNVLSQKETLIREKVERGIAGKLAQSEERIRELEAEITALKASTSREEMLNLFNRQFLLQSNVPANEIETLGDLSKKTPEELTQIIKAKRAQRKERT